ncbi:MULTISPECIES: SHOCT domain-containing protein [Clostridium]|uniref:SHOCT domain-containing protein n=1 Tax=Clostridium manihotivorum TaxID=2320868 RepID=A0A3R5QYX3_9CLOT|nr:MULTISPECIES: SHOCT domain-containing protein [Clostridium]KLE14364.1 membrane protein [Clostridium sp. C8]QAA32837.1 SHOCT domain-containing protein [Clostridium manihotivorum]UZQ48938.1 SHOCT domain-containing protein [Clostridium kluyveri]
MFCGGFGGYGFGSAGPLSYTWMFLAMGFRLLVFIGLVVLAVKLFKSYTNKSEDNMRILNERFARGEISEEEYIRRRTILSQKN